MDLRGGWRTVLSPIHFQIAQSLSFPIPLCAVSPGLGAGSSTRRVMVGQLENFNIPPHTEVVLGLFPGHVHNGYPDHEAPCLARTFGQQYLKSNSEYPYRG